MELVQLSQFRVIARLEHMTRAAEELNVTQPSLSRTLARLEHELGVPLFDRRGRGLRLTEYGAVFLRHVDRVFQELEDATTELRDMGGMERGQVTLSAGALHWLPPVLEPFLAAHPEVRFRLSRQSLPELIRQIEDGEVDFCFLPDVPLRAGIAWRHLRTAPIALMVPTSHRLAGRSGVSLTELAGEEVILGRPGDILRETMEDYFRQAGFRPQIASEVDEPAAVSDFVAAGLGVAFIPGLLELTPPHDFTARVTVTDPPCRLTLGLAWSRERYLSLAAQAFRDHVISHFATETSAVGSGSPPARRPSPQRFPARLSPGSEPEGGGR